MPDISADCGGIRSPNPFWLASAPPTNTGDQVHRAFDAGWGGAVWKTLGQPIVNVSSRYGGLHHGDRRIIGLNNIELITDRPIETNFREIAEVKKRWPKNAVIASLMVETREEWKEFIQRSVDSGADGIELNFGCPHGMCERGMGSAVGQEPKVNERITSWAKEFSTIPVLVKLTPNVSDIVPHGLASKRGGADGVSLINTIKSLIGVDIDRFVPNPRVGARSTNGGYCGPAVKPIALHMCAALARNPSFGLPISAIGGVATWRDAVEFMLLGAANVQVCTAVMHHGFRIVKDMTEGLLGYMEEKGFERLGDFIGKAVPAFTEWGDLDLNYKVVAKINPDTCIGCQKCFIACYDGSHQCIHLPSEEEGLDPVTAAKLKVGGAVAARVPFVDEEECVGCNLCQMVCPVPDCIQMVEVKSDQPLLTYKDFAKMEQERKAAREKGKVGVG
jgi:dihydropyrimidine dehydrogenase (NAD+) subunit PreA